MTKIKICGLRRKEDIEYANEYKPDYIGFVFADSKRKVTKEQARVLKGLLSPDIIAVGVFVNEEVQKIAELVNEGIIDMVQLHGNETNEYIEELRSQIGATKIIKAVRVAGYEDVIACENTAADYLLFDTFSTKEYGGTGKAFDWELIRNVKKPFFLAGGIGSDNVKKAIEMCSPYAVDISSAIETDGYKDKAKIEQIFRHMKE